MSDGQEVTVLDDFSVGRMENLAQISNHPGLSIQCADVADFHQIRPLFDGVEWVFHLAGLADIVPSIEDPLKYHRANVDGTVAVLQAAREAGVKKLVYAASSSCYGLPDRFPTPETAAIRPMYPYALTKFLAEECVLHWNNIYKLPCVSLRLFNVYGPRSRTTGVYGAVFGIFLAQKLEGKPFTVVGDGKQTRDFTYVTDVADAFVCAAASDLAGEVLNVGSGNTYSINTLVRLLEGEVTYLPKRPGEPDCTFADIEKIGRLIGWGPKVSFPEGVQNMLNHIELWRDAPVWDEESISKATQTWFKYLGDGPPVATSNQND